MTSINDIAGSLDEQNEQQQQQKTQADQAAAASQNSDKVVNAVDKNTQSTADGLKSVKGDVNITNPDLAKSQDVNQAVEAINKLNLTTFMQNEGLPQLAKNLNDLSGKTQDLQDKLENEGLKKMSDQLGLVVKKLDEVGKTLSKAEVSVDAKLQKTIDSLSKSINAIDFKPAVNVSAPQAKVVTTPVDFGPILKALAGVEQAVKDSEAPESETDLTPVTGGLSAVQNAIQALRFPVPNYVLPFVDNTGKATQVKLDSSGNLPIAASGGSTNLVVGSADYYPGYNATNKGAVPLNTDPYGNLSVRGAVLTDEGTHRANFTGAAVAWTIASVTFTNGSATVRVAAGFSTADIHYLDFIRLGTDAESAWGQVSFINSDTTITLSAPYTGTGGTGTANVSGVATSTGSGATLTVASGALTVAAGTTAASQSYIYTGVNGGPDTFQTNASVSQRIANQDIYFGFESMMTATIKSFSRFHFTGTTNTQVITETGWNPTGVPSASEQETNTVTLPNASTTATAHNYRIDQRFEVILFYIDDVLVAQHKTRIPHVYAEGNNAYQAGVRVLNGTTPATGTSIVVNGILTRDYDSLDVYQSNQGTLANSQLSQITDGTNTANVLKSDGTAAGENALLTAGSFKEMASLTAGSLNADLVPSTDVSGYKWLSLQVTGTWSATVSFQFSNDNSNWTNAQFARLDQSSNTVANSTTSNVIVHGPALARFFRARLTAYTSGTATGVLELYASPAQLHTIGVAAQQLGTWSVGSNSATSSAVPANAFYMGMQSTTNTLVPLNAAGLLGDAQTNGVAAIAGFNFNGTNWDRTRTATSAANTTGTGLLGVGLLEWDGTNYQRVPAARFAPASTKLNTNSYHLTTNTTTTPTASTAYVSSIAISSEVAGTTSTITIQDKQATPSKLINGFSTTTLTTTPTVVNFQTPVLMTSGIDIITAGAVAATVDIFINWYQ